MYESIMANHLEPFFGPAIVSEEETLADALPARYCENYGHNEHLSRLVATRLRKVITDDAMLTHTIPSAAEPPAPDTPLEKYAVGYCLKHGFSREKDAQLVFETSLRTAVDAMAHHVRAVVVRQLAHDGGISRGRLFIDQTRVLLGDNTPQGVYIVNITVRIGVVPL